MVLVEEINKKLWSKVKLVSTGSSESVSCTWARVKDLVKRVPEVSSTMRKILRMWNVTMKLNSNCCAIFNHEVNK